MKRHLTKITAIALFLGLGGLGLLMGAQVIAAHYDYNTDILGKALLQVGSVRIYGPTKMFEWGRQYGTEAECFRIAYLWCLGGCALGVVSALIVRFVGDRSIGETTRNVYGDAAFATQEDIREMRLVGRGRGVFLGKTPSGNYIRHDGPEHYAIIAPTRSGKGAGIVVPTLLTWRESCVVYDLKEENYQRTSGERSRFSDILYFNPNSLETVRFNPLLEIRPGIFEVRDAQNLANMIIEPDRPGVHDHWIRTGNSLLTAAILHIMYTAPAEEKNLRGVAALLSRPEKGLTETLQEMLETRHLRDERGVPIAAHPGVVAAVRDVLNKSGDDKSSVVSTVMGYLGIYRDPLLANATSASDFSIDDLVNGDRPKSLYMVIPAGDIDRLRPVIRIMVNLICRRLTEKAVTGKLRDQEHKHKLLLMLDEFPALGRLEFFETALGFLAGYGLKAMLVAQSLSQLKQVYGDRSSILDNTHVRVLFRPETVETAEYISKTLGQSTVQFKTRSEGGKKGSPFFSNVNEALHFGSRPLLTPREVMELPDDEALVMVGGGRPIRARKIRYFDDGSFVPLLHPPAEVKTNKLGAPKSVWFQERYGPVSTELKTPMPEPAREEAKTAPKVTEDKKPTDKKVVLNHPNRRRKKAEPRKNRSSIEDLEVGDLA